MKSLSRWGETIVGQKTPESVLSIQLDGQQISRVELFKREVLLGDEVLQAGCIGGVWTASAYRRRGFAAQLMEQASVMFQKWGYDVALLFSLEATVAYYRKFFFERLTGVVTMRQPGGVVVVPEHVATMIAGVGSYVVVETDVPLDIRGLPW